MIPPQVAENKGDIAITAAGAGMGALAGNYAYKKLPDRLVKYKKTAGGIKPEITDRFINYAKDVSIKDLQNNIDRHTKRSWLEQQINIIKDQASSAKLNHDSPDRKLLQKTYNLGIKFLTDRESVPVEDEVLAKRGANAIIYGKKMEKSKTVFAFAVLGGLIFLAGKKIAEKMSDIKEKGKELQSKLPFENPAAKNKN